MEFFFDISYNLHLEGGGKTVVAGKLAPEIKDIFQINFNSNLLCFLWVKTGGPSVKQHETKGIVNPTLVINVIHV